MGKIHATMNISLDGCCDHTQVLADDEFHEKISDLFDSFAALLFGRVTYDLLHAYWPAVASSQDGTPGMVRLAHVLNKKPKFVVSSRDVSPDWQAERTAATREAMKAVRDRVDGDILLVASPTLSRTMLEWGLLAEYHVAVSPMVAGHGPHFLEGISAKITTTLVDLDRLRSGVLLIKYGVRPSR